MPEAQNSPPNDRTLSSTAYAQTRRDADDEGHLPAGTMIGDTFKVLSFIGAGGMSNVYKCEDLSIGRIIAVKTLQAGFSKEALRRFQTEGKAIAKLEHPNVLKLYGLQVLPDGLPILVMEFVPGVTLARLLESRQPLTVQRALRIGAQIGEGLKAAEKKGIIHRDLKPSNIMIINPGGIDEQVKILDFGIAKIQDEAPIDATRTGEVFGTPQYMSPEQAMGKKCDVRSDQYSFGCVLFEMLTGSPPFTCDNSLSVMMAHVQDAVPSVSSSSKNRIPPHLELAITRLLQKDPARRYATMDDALNSLFNASKSGQFNNKFLLIAIAGVFTILTIAAGYFYYSANIENQELKESAGSSQQQQQQQQQKKVSDVTKMHSQQVELSSIDREWMNNWKSSSNQKTIKIPKSQISQSGLKAIANIKGLESLSLDRCERVDSAGIAELRNLKLRFLSLNGTSIDDQASKTIMAIPTLESLYVNDTDVTTNFCEKISISRNLKQLSLGSTKIDGSALAYLANIKSLVDLEISGDDISGKLNELDLAHLLKLNLKGVNLSPDDINAVTKLRDLATLNVSSTLITDQNLLQLANLPKLRTLVAKSCINIHETGIAAFKKAAPNCELILNEEQSYHKSDDSIFGTVALTRKSNTNTTGPDLIRNGSFEEGGKLQNYTDFRKGETKIPHWNITAGSVGLTGLYWKAADGSNSLELNGAGPGAIAQTFKTEPGSEYQVSFDATINPNSPINNVQKTVVSVNGQSETLNFKYNKNKPNAMRWQKFYWQFKASSRSTTLQFNSTEPGGCGPVIDNVSVKKAKAALLPVNL